MKKRMSLAAAAVVLALAGCAAIPTSSGVQSGGVIDTETQVQGVYQPSGPKNGSSPENIVTDFIQAALDPQNDYATAREFLTGDEQQKWDPNASVSIQQSTGSATLEPGNHVIYTTSVVANVTAAGVYSEQKPNPLTPSFDLVQVTVNGSKQWRISKPNPGVIISESTFNAVYAAHPLYFFAPGYKYLVPDVRWFATTDSVTTRIANALLAGPASWLASPVLVTAFPPGTTLDDAGVSVDNAVATVDLSTDAKSASTATDRSRMQQQMSESLTSVANVRSVALTVGGAVLAAPASGPASSVQPSVNPATLVMLKNSFGFTTGEAVTSIGGISDKVKAVGALDATYSIASSVLVARTASGVYRVRVDADPFLVDKRAGSSLTDPSLDNVGFVWSAQSKHLTSLNVYAADGTSKKVDVSSVGDARVISMAVSRDGSRLLLYLDRDDVPQLVVAGIIRDPNNFPVKLAPDPVSLAVTPGMPIDATWESDRTVAAISGTGSSAAVTEYAIGGPSTALGTVPFATQIVGGNGGASGLRVLDASGVVFRSAGTASVWQKAGFTASFLATQQPG